MVFVSTSGEILVLVIFILIIIIGEGETIIKVVEVIILDIFHLCHLDKHFMGINIVATGLTLVYKVRRSGVNGIYKVITTEPIISTDVLAVEEVEYRGNKIMSMFLMMNHIKKKIAKY